jgi:hypothetical protein
MDELDEESVDAMKDLSEALYFMARDGDHYNRLGELWVNCWLHPEENTTLPDGVVSTEKFCEAVEFCVQFAVPTMRAIVTAERILKEMNETKSESRRADPRFALLFDDEAEERSIDEIARKARGLRSALCGLAETDVLVGFVSPVRTDSPRTWIENRELWRRALLWFRGATALDTLRERAAAPGGAGFKRASASFSHAVERKRCKFQK